MDSEETNKTDSYFRVFITVIFQRIKKDLTCKFTFYDKSLVKQLKYIPS